MVTSLRLGPGCATAWPAVRRRVALCSSISGVAFRADGCLPSGGRARSESVSASCAMVGWALSIGLIDLPFSHWTATMDACHVQTRVTPARPLVHSQASSPEGSRPGGPSDGGDESPGADGCLDAKSAQPTAVRQYAQLTIQDNPCGIYKEVAKLTSVDIKLDQTTRAASSRQLS
jgi:hypothetical protein